MCTKHAKRTDLEAPAWVVEEWSKGSKARDDMAHILQSVNFSKDFCFDSCFLKTSWFIYIA